MAEQQIANLATRAAPLTRTTKDSEEFELLAVNATFNGAGAGGDFLPCVEVVSDAGLVVARNVATEAVAAGDSVEVTFAPFLGRASASGSITVATAAYSGSNVNIASGATGTILWDSFDAGADLLDLSVPGAPTVRTAGFYIVTSVVQCRTAGISFRQDFGFSSLGPGSSSTGLTGDLSGLGATGYVTLTIAAQLSAADGLFTQVLNQGALAANFFELQGSVALLA